MPTKIKIIVKDIILAGELTDTACAAAIAQTLPLDVKPDEWGDEFYFEIPISASPDQTATTKVKAGDIGYWPPGRALAIFFGRTPASSGPDPVPASAVNIVGQIAGDASVLKRAKGAARLRIEKG